MNVLFPPRWLCGGLFAALFMVFGASAGAAPMYSVTDLGSERWLNLPDTNGGFSSVYDLQNNREVPITFPVSSTDRIPYPQASSLPTAYAYEGLSATAPTQFQMRVFAANSQGTVIGGLPFSNRASNPESELKLGYAQMQPDGTFGPFQQILAPNNDTNPAYSSNWYMRLQLNTKNQILVTGYNRDGINRDGEILDLNAHTTTPLDSLIPAALLAKYGYFNAVGFADNGSIIATAGLPYDARVVFLSLPVPEPSSFVVVAAGIGAVAVVRKFRRD